MVLNVAGALSAYSKSGGLGDAAGGAASQSGGGSTFGDLVKTFSSDAIGDLKSGEQAATSSVTGIGKPDLASIATAIDKAEIVLTEITTIRDKAIAAYQTITGSAI
jgi:flagellar hook-basal body complex protein FliE